PAVGGARGNGHHGRRPRRTRGGAGGDRQGAPGGRGGRRLRLARSGQAGGPAQGAGAADVPARPRPRVRGSGAGARLVPQVQVGGAGRFVSGLAGQSERDDPAMQKENPPRGGFVSRFQPSNRWSWWAVQGSNL